MEELPWWKDPDYMVGKLSGRSRFVRIRNVITEHTDLMEVYTYTLESIIS